MNYFYKVKQCKDGSFLYIKFINPYYVNYAYFQGGSARSLGILKSKIRETNINSIIVEDDVNEGSFFARVLEKDVDTFLKLVNPRKYKEIKLPKSYISEIQNLFGDNLEEKDKVVNL